MCSYRRHHTSASTWDEAYTRSIQQDGSPVQVCFEEMSRFIAAVKMGILVLAFIHSLAVNYLLAFPFIPTAVNGTCSPEIHELDADISVLCTQKLLCHFTDYYILTGWITK